MDYKDFNRDRLYRNTGKRDLIVKGFLNNSSDEIVKFIQDIEGGNFKNFNRSTGEPKR